MMISFLSLELASSPWFSLGSWCELYKKKKKKIKRGWIWCIFLLKSRLWNILLAYDDDAVVGRREILKLIQFQASLLRNLQFLPPLLASSIHSSSLSSLFFSNIQEHEAIFFVIFFLFPKRGYLLHTPSPILPSPTRNTTFLLPFLLYHHLHAGWGWSSHKMTVIIIAALANRCS